MAWENEDKIFISVKVNKSGTLGKIAKANALAEELKNTLRELEHLISAEESQPE